MSIDRSAFWVPELQELEQLSTNRVCALRCELVGQLPKPGHWDRHRITCWQRRFCGTRNVGQRRDGRGGGGFADVGVVAGHGGGGVVDDALAVSSVAEM